MMKCPDDNELAALLSGQLSDADAERIQEHLDTCPVCAELFLAHGDLLAPQDGPPEQIGRYEVQEILGQGAMGVVYLARDPSLERRVAVKVLHPELRDPGTRAAQQARLLQEARALASLSHPNIVTVHDVGEHEGQVFLALEYVEGPTMRDWLRDTAPDWDAALDAYLQAGRGLAHAHAAGLVHRDVKPDNLLVEQDTGRVLVTDFGLVRARPEPSGGRTLNLELAQTATGALLGTPAYMAPEQFEGLDADAASDQYALATCIYEALYGRRPYFAHDLASLSELVRTTPPRDPGASEIPRPLFEVLARALSASPRARFEDLPAMLGALERARHPTPSTRRPAIAAAVILTGALGLAWSMTPGDTPKRPRTPAPAEREATIGPKDTIVAPKETATPAPVTTPSETTPSPAPTKTVAERAPKPAGARKPRAPKLTPDQQRNERYQKGNIELVKMAHTRKWKACLRLAPKVMALARSDHERQAVERSLYLCEMMSGDCKAGSKRYRKLQEAAGMLTPGAITRQLANLQAQYCRTEQGDLATQLERLWTQMSVAKGAVDVARCRSLEKRAIEVVSRNEAKILKDGALHSDYRLLWTHARQCLDPKDSCKKRWERHRRSELLERPRYAKLPSGKTMEQRGFLRAHPSCAAIAFGGRFDWEVAGALLDTIPAKDHKACRGVAARMMKLPDVKDMRKKGLAIHRLRRASGCAATASDCALARKLFDRMLAHYDLKGLSPRELAATRELQRKQTLQNLCK